MRGVRKWCRQVSWEERKRGREGEMEERELEAAKERLRTEKNYSAEYSTEYSTAYSMAGMAGIVACMIAKPQFPKKMT
jgi:hypothetical protein